MSERNSTVKVTEGMGLLGWLTIVFIVLKLLGHISWSWWWVLAPIWIPVAICVLILIVLGIITIIVELIK